MSSGGDGKTFSNVSADQGPFALLGGVYGFTVMAGTWGGGSVTVQTLGMDGSTWITTLAPFTTNGYAALSLPPGQYKLAVATATGVYLAVSRINP